MISQRTRGLLGAILFCQASLAGMLLAVVAELTFSFFTSATEEQWSRYPIYGLIVAVGLVYEAMTRNRSRLRYSPWQRSLLKQHQLALRETAFGIGALLLFLALTKDQTISRTFLLLYLPALYLGLLGTNVHLPRALARTIFGGVHTERSLLIGAPERAEGLKDWLAGKEVLGFRTVGLLNDEGTGRGANGIPHLGRVADLETVARAEQVTQVLVMELPQDRQVHRLLVATTERLGLRLVIQSNLAELLHHPVVHVEDDGLRFITLREEPLENPLNRLLKRGLDLAVSSLVVVFILPPVAVLVWILHRLESPGPLFFYQKRAGIQNRQFRIVKFRTMCLNNDDETRQAVPGDVRVFPAGRWLRRLSIDELPQFLNVLRGEMSVTGPRPHLLEHNALFAAQMANYHIRTFVKPGITGLAQVRGFRGEAKSPTEIAQRLESDISYLENWRLVLDLSIIVRTAWQMLTPPKSAY